MHNQTYPTITNHLGCHRHNFGTLFSDFWSFSPKIGYFWAQISPILARGGSQNLQNLPKCVNSFYNQTYLTINNRLVDHRNIFGTLFSDFLTTSPKIGYFWAQLSPILARGGSQNLQNLPKCVNSFYNQTYLTIANRLVDHRNIFGTLFSDFLSTSPKIGYFWAQLSPILANGRSQNLKNLLECINSLYNQTYLTITNRLGDDKNIFGTLFSDFLTTSPKIGYFWAQIWRNWASSNAKTA